MSPTEDAWTVALALVDRHGEDGAEKYAIDQRKAMHEAGDTTKADWWKTVLERVQSINEDANRIRRRDDK